MIKSIVFLLIFSSWSSSATEWINTPLKEKIIESELIVQGVVEKIKAINLSTDSVVTTFYLNKLKVLKGSYKKTRIKVQEEGGCINENCFYTPFSYDLDKGDNVVIFLKYDSKLKAYKSIQAANTVYTVDKNNYLSIKSTDQKYQKSGADYIIRSPDGSLIAKPGLTLQILNDSIQ